MAVWGSLQCLCHCILLINSARWRGGGSILGILLCLLIIFLIFFVFFRGNICAKIVSLHFFIWRKDYSSSCLAVPPSYNFLPLLLPTYSTQYIHTAVYRALGKGGQAIYLSDSAHNQELCLMSR